MHEYETCGGWIAPQRKKSRIPLALGLTVALLLVVVASQTTSAVRSSPSTPLTLESSTAPLVAASTIAAFAGTTGASSPLVVATGDAIVVVVSAHYDTAVTGVSDSSSNSYSSVASVHTGTSASLAIWVAANVPASPNLAVTIALSRSAATLLAVTIVSGAAAAPVDVVGPAVSSPNSNTIHASIVTIAPEDLVLLGIAATGLPTVTPEGGLSSGSYLTSSEGSTHQMGAVLSTNAPSAGELNLSAQISSDEGLAADAIGLKSSGQHAPLTYPVSGTVTNTKSKDLVGATVSTEVKGVPATAITNSEGAYQLSLPNGTYTLMATALQYYSENRSVTVAGAAKTGINFALKPDPTNGLPGGGVVQHVVVIYLENQPLSSVLASAPYERYLAFTFGEATEFYGSCHPSIPNYLASTSGVDYGCGSDAYHQYALTNVGDLLQAANLTWAGYFENMPKPCDTSNSGSYVVHHNPFVFYDDIVSNTTRCDTHDLPSTDWKSQLATGTLLNYSFYVPNNRDDGDTTSLTFADNWLKGFLAPILNSSTPTMEKTLAHTAFFILYDESDTKDTSGYSGVMGGHVYSVLVSPFSHGTQYSLDATEYNLLSTIEWLFGLGSTGNNDGTATFPAMTSLFQFS